MTTTVKPERSEPGTIPQRRVMRSSLLVGSLNALIAANLIQVLAAFSDADPSPPPSVVPAIAATVLLGIAARPMVIDGDRLGYKLGIGFCLASMVGMGPHKLFLDDGLVIAPMALVGFSLALVFIAQALRALRALRAGRGQR